jgi:hypothetical protein
MTRLEYFVGRTSTSVRMGLPPPNSRENRVGQTSRSAAGLQTRLGQAKAPAPRGAGAFACAKPPTNHDETQALETVQT